MKIKFAFLAALLVVGFNGWTQEVDLPETPPLPTDIPDDSMFEELPVGLTCMQFLSDYNPKEACQNGDTAERDRLRRKYLSKTPAVINAWDFALKMRRSVENKKGPDTAGMRGISQDSMTLLLATAQIGSVMTRMCKSFYRDCGIKCPELDPKFIALEKKDQLKSCAELYNAAQVFHGIAKGNLDFAKQAASSVAATSAAPAASVGGK